MNTKRDTHQPTSSSALTKRSRNRGRPQPNHPFGQPRIGSSYISRKEVKGGKLNVPPNPPDVTYQPWYPATVVMQHGGGELKCTLETLANTLVKQIDPLTHAFRAVDDTKVNKRGGPLFQVRVRNVRAWNLTGHMIALSVNDLTANTKSNTDTLCGIVDTGATTHTPAVGYELPQSHRDLVFHNDGQDMDDPIFHVITPPNDASIIYVGVFWRCDGPSKFSAFAQSMLSLASKATVRNKALASNNKIVSGIASDVQSSRVSLSKIEEHTDKGGIGNAIVKGVEIAAPYVLPIAAAEDRAVMERLASALERQSLSSASSFYNLPSSGEEAVESTPN